MHPSYFQFQIEEIEAALLKHGWKPGPYTSKRIASTGYVVKTRKWVGPFEGLVLLIRERASGETEPRKLIDVSLMLDPRYDRSKRAEPSLIKDIRDQRYNLSQYSHTIPNSRKEILSRIQWFRNTYNLSYRRKS